MTHSNNSLLSSWLELTFVGFKSKLTRNVKQKLWNLPLWLIQFVLWQPVSNPSVLATAVVLSPTITWVIWAGKCGRLKEKLSLYWRGETESRTNQNLIKLYCNCFLHQQESKAAYIWGRHSLTVKFHTGTFIYISGLIMTASNGRLL